MQCEARGFKMAGSQDHVGRPAGRLSAGLSGSFRGDRQEGGHGLGRRQEGDMGRVKGGPDQGLK